jgi:hypothetical protein
MWNLTRRSRRAPSSRPTDAPVPAVLEDLVRLGVEPDFAAVAAERLGPRAAGLDREAYAALLQGVALAHGVQQDGADESATEIQKLVQDFAVELQKLDEGLKLLSSYLLRIRDRSRDDSTPPVVH